LLVVEGASKHYGLAKVLHDVSFEVRPGEVHALLGGNGSGKSTLIKALAGVISFDSGGSIITPVGSVATQKWSPSHAREAGLRFVHQDIGLFGALHLMDNLSLGDC
jgi:ribose transport system ATP-binding protein